MGCPELMKLENSMLGSNHSVLDDLADYCQELKMTKNGSLVTDILFLLDIQAYDVSELYSANITKHKALINTSETTVKIVNH